MKKIEFSQKLVLNSEKVSTLISYDDPLIPQGMAINEQGVQVRPKAKTNASPCISYYCTGNGGGQNTGGGTPYANQSVYC
ncbi:MAG: hypothetical protein J0L87_08075 [Bacteroidetes bacterium]|nr:hypothetical protein [Bacteroidota bacterium]